MGPRSVSTPTGERARLTQRGSTAPARTRRSWLHRLLQIHSPPLAAIEGSISCRQQRHNPAIAALLKHPSRHAPRLAASGIVEIRRIATGSTEGLFDEGSLQPRVGIPKCRHGRIGIMHNGRLLETGRAETLYRRPASRFPEAELDQVAGCLRSKRKSKTPAQMGTAIAREVIQRRDRGRY